MPQTGPMDTRDLLSDLARRPLDALDHLSDRMDPARLNAHPGGHPNSPAWLLWHAAREIDVQVAQLSGLEQVWAAQGFDARFGLDLEPDDLGYGHTERQARAVTVPEDPTGLQLLDQHLRAVIAQAQEYLQGLSDEDLKEIVDPDGDPPVTRGVRLVSVFDDAAQHIAQADYVMGMPEVR